MRTATRLGVAGALLAGLIGSRLVLASDSNTSVDLEGAGVRYRCILARPSPAAFANMAGEFLGPQEVRLGAIAAYGSLRDRLLAGPRGGDHCGYESWRALTASRDLTPDGCPQVQEAIKIGNNVVIRSLDRDCRRTVSLRGTTNPLSLSVAGSTFEVLEIGFSRPIGDQNIHRIAADFYIRAHAAVSKDIAEAILAQVRSVTRTPYLGVRLRSDTLFLTDCSFPAFYPFEDRPTIPNENEFYGMKYAACTVAGTWPIRCFEGVGRP